jgi:hypothetical protein
LSLISLSVRAITGPNERSLHGGREIKGLAWKDLSKRYVCSADRFRKFGKVPRKLEDIPLFENILLSVD